MKMWEIYQSLRYSKVNQALFKNDTDVVVVEIISLENSSCWILTPLALKDGAFVDIYNGETAHRGDKRGKG